MPWALTLAPEDTEAQMAVGLSHCPKDGIPHCRPCVLEDRLLPQRQPVAPGAHQQHRASWNKAWPPPVLVGLPPLEASQSLEIPTTVDVEKWGDTASASLELRIQVRSVSLQTQTAAESPENPTYHRACPEEI
ncbi:hypothetical protein H920_01535 [Fukomys damarensis]|uniref:Uncharacterized protein n=1 Tax=Fukomys damarensis TaxID=885580 RepID=A0A091DY57_FUKDA|nr:hypothetical protein H920_01535 [Fukomys damarensis]